MLRFKADRRTLAFIGIYFGLVAFQWFYEPRLLWMAIPLFVATCFFSFFGAVSTHNSIHCPIFKQKWMNKAFQVVLSLTYGHPVSSYVPGHNLSHHKHTETVRDVMRTSKARFGYNLLNLFFFAASVAPGIMKADSRYTLSMRTRHPRWFRQLLLEHSFVIASTVVLIAIDWRKGLLYWLLPHLYAQWGIVTMNLLQHDGCDATTEYNHSRNFVGKVVNWWTFNNGYHSIHHEIPGLHWSLLPEAHAKQIHPHIHPNLEQPSLLAYVFRTFVLGKREKYDGTPHQLVPKGRDEEWIPLPSETPDDLGAEAA